MTSVKPTAVVYVAGLVILLFAALTDQTLFGEYMTPAYWHRRVAQFLPNQNIHMYYAIASLLCAGYWPCKILPANRFILLPLSGITVGLFCMPDFNHHFFKAETLLTLAGTSCASFGLMLMIIRDKTTSIFKITVIPALLPLIVPWFMYDYYPEPRYIAAFCAGLFVSLVIYRLNRQILNKLNV